MRHRDAGEHRRRPVRPTRGPLHQRHPVGAGRRVRMGDEVDQGPEVTASGDDVDPAARGQAATAQADDDPAASSAAPADPPESAEPVNLTRPAPVAGPSAEADTVIQPGPVPRSDPAPLSDHGQSAQVAEPSGIAPPAPLLVPAVVSPPAAEPGTETAAGPEATPAAESPAATESALADAVDGIQTALSALGDRVGGIADAAAELARLRSRDADLIGRLHDDVTRLRTGEIAAALNPVVTGMIKLHDQMVSLGALSDLASPVGMLHTQLLQILELTCAVKPFAPSAGEQFDASHHTGAKRIATTAPAADGTAAATIKTGFVRADGSVVRVADVEVHRLSG